MKPRSRARSRKNRFGWAAVGFALLFIALSSQSLGQNQRIAVASDQASNESSPPRPPQDYDYAAGGRSFVIRPDQQAVSEIDAAGALLWTREFATPLTSAAVEGPLSAWGFLDGSIKIIGETGESLSDLHPAAQGIVSEYSCVYSVALARNGSGIAALYGLNPQYFVFFERQGQGYKTLFARKLEGQTRRAQMAVFSGSGSYLAGGSADGLILYDIARKRESLKLSEFFSEKTELLIEAIGGDSFAFLLANGQKRFAGLIAKGVVEAFFAVPADSSSISVAEGELKVSAKGRELRYKVERP